MRRQWEAENGGIMLPAVSAELPAYLVPQTTRPVSRSVDAGSTFGPAAVAELSVDQARAAQSRRPGVGLYGPDGRFIEPTSERSDSSRSTQQPTQGNPPATSQVTDRSQSDAAEQSAQQEVRKRDLSLSQIDAAVPPAQREELRQLAEHVRRKPDAEPLEVRDYKQIASLMDRVGRYDEAQQAMDKAKELEAHERSAAEEAAKEPTAH